MLNATLQSPRNQANIICLNIIVSGFVQGVGFRPFVLRLANELVIKGYVTNNLGQVSIVAQANRQTLSLFCERLISQAPLNARPVIHSVKEISAAGFNAFSIKQSDELGEKDIHILVDLATCDQCVEELFDKHNRRYFYPFINCTQCGPRNSIIFSLPYDRKNTSMGSFKLCSECEDEYLTADNRRFHAEPIACESCGPVLNFVDDTNDITDNPLALEACVAALNQDKIIAVKGIGGYHLMCDATSTKAIALLRKRKHRPDKPFALLMEQAQLHNYVDATEQELNLLQENSRPIVLIKRNSDCLLPKNLAPGFNRLGVMLPGNPLQHLICHLFNKPLVATSANISGEPILTDNAEATKRLVDVCDAFLHHNRAIVRPADDPVKLHNHHQTQILRTGRGITPTEFTLPFTLQKPLLAVGGHIKNTIALAWQNRLVISSHNGDLSNLRSYQTFQRAVKDLQQLYQVKAERIICDAHTGYASTQWAIESALPVSKIFHHRAHASSLMLEALKNNAGFNETSFNKTGVNNWLVFCWDGVGQGDDDTLWGGETFSGSPGNWQRVASFKPFRLPGGEKTAREAWRVAASLCWQSGIDFEMKNKPVDQLKMIWDKNINCPQSTAAGRLFSAAACILGLLQDETYEGHGPMLLETLAETQQEINISDVMSLPIIQDKNILRIDWQPIIPMLKNQSLSTAWRARCFHETLAECIYNIALRYSKDSTNLVTGFSGGVFQNQLLVRLIRQRFEKQNLAIFIPSSIPVNDGGLCAGQIIEHHFTSTTINE